MEITIGKCDALSLLAVSTKNDVETLSERIVEVLYALGYIGKEKEDCGKTLQDIAEMNCISVTEIAHKLFLTKEINPEVIEILDSITLTALSADVPCPLCGCELHCEEDSAEGHLWVNETCTNSECSYSISNEPDWDCMPGGADYE